MRGRFRSTIRAPTLKYFYVAVERIFQTSGKTYTARSTSDDRHSSACVGDLVAHSMRFFFVRCLVDVAGFEEDCRPSVDRITSGPRKNGPARAEFEPDTRHQPIAELLGKM